MRIESENTFSVLSALSRAWPLEASRIKEFTFDVLKYGFEAVRVIASVIPDGVIVIAVRFSVMKGPSVGA
jgi:hypothetical protein